MDGIIFYGIIFCGRQIPEKDGSLLRPEHAWADDQASVHAKRLREETALGSLPICDQKWVSIFYHAFRWVVGDAHLVYGMGMG